MADKLDMIIAQVSEVGKRIGHLDTKVDSVTSTLAAHGERLAAIEVRCEESVSRGDISELFATHVKEYHHPRRRGSGSSDSIARPSAVPPSGTFAVTLKGEGTRAAVKLIAAATALAGAVYAIVELLM